MKAKRHGWPLGFFPEFDRIARDEGLPHWSCVLPNANAFWLRRDGGYLSINLVESWPHQLRQYDRQIPMQKPCAIFRGATRR